MTKPITIRMGGYGPPTTSFSKGLTLIGESLVAAFGDRVDVKLAQPVNVYWIYVTAWATPDGIVQFRPDVYQRDGAGPGPLASAVPAQPMALPQE